MNNEQAKSELMQIYMSLSEEKKQALDVLMAQADGEYISRQAVLDITWEEPSYTDGLNVLTEVRDKIKALPSVKPQKPKTGHWVGIDEEPHEVWECDHCGFVIDGSGCIDPYDYRDTYKFCPNCGARMVEPQESEDTNG